MRLNIKENGRFIIWKVVNILIHLLTEILAYCKALKVKISVHSNFPYRFTHSGSDHDFAVHLVTQPLLLFSTFLLEHSFMLKSYVVWRWWWGGVVAYVILVSAQVLYIKCPPLKSTLKFLPPFTL